MLKIISEDSKPINRERGSILRKKPRKFVEKVFEELFTLLMEIIKTLLFSPKCSIMSSSNNKGVSPFSARRVGKKGLCQGGGETAVFRKGRGRMNRAWIELDKEALRHNIQRYESLLPAGCRIMGVVKADAYGHGAQAVAPFLESLGIDHFATATLDEAVRLREYGIKGEILILGYSAPSGFPALAEYDLTQTATCREHAAQLEQYGREHGRKLKVHIAVDTGMHRIGFRMDDAEGIRRLYESGDLRVTGIYSHLCVADTEEEEHVEFSIAQAERFRRLVDTLRGQGVELGTVHLLSSYAAVNYPDYAYDYARLGILMFGVKSDPGDFLRQDLQPRPVMTLKAHITSVREIGAGESVSYGRIFRAEGPTKIASVAIGYADGIPRCLSGGKLRAIVRGQYVRGAGRICMDQLMLDVTGVEGVSVGDEAVLIGRDGPCAIYAEELAVNSGSITNELFSRLGARLEGRRFQDRAD